MADYQVAKIAFMNRLHDTLPLLGGSAADYEVTGIEEQPGEWIRVKTVVVDQPTLEAFVDSHNSLVVVASKLTIDADLVDESVLTIVGLTDIDYDITLQSASVASGSVIDGSVEFSTDTPGEYLIELTETGTNNTGYVVVTAL